MNYFDKLKPYEYWQCPMCGMWNHGATNAWEKVRFRMVACLGACPTRMSEPGKLGDPPHVHCECSHCDYMMTRAVATTAAPCA